MSRRTKNLFSPASTEPFVISRTKLSDFLDCPRCFYLDRRMGLSKPSMPAFSLNIAVDALLKREFDAYRARQEPHPIMTRYGVAAVPFSHPHIELWRNNFKGIRFHHQPSNLILFGAVDDVWKNVTDELNVVDYKATSTSEVVITLDNEYRQKYKRQLEIYQWLFHQNGFKVSPRSFIVYANAKKDRDAFDARLDFDMQLIEHQGDNAWVDDALVKAKECLLQDVPPGPSLDCEWCEYRKQ